MVRHVEQRKRSTLSYLTAAKTPVIALCAAAIVVAGPTSATPASRRGLLLAGAFPPAIVTAASASPEALRVVAMSDTHGFHRSVDVPSGDMLVHSGDVTHWEDRQALEDFCRWFADQPHRFKFLISGNHERAENLREGLKQAVAQKATQDPAGNAPIFLDRRKNARRAEGLRIWGWPFSWQEQAPSEIPEGLDILITHVPPKGVLDLSVRDGSHAGNPTLTQALARLEKPPRLHIFGHIHEGHGAAVWSWPSQAKAEKAQSTLCINAALANDGSARQASKPCVVVDFPLATREAPKVIAGA